MTEDINITLMNDIRLTENVIKRSRGKRKNGHGKGRIIHAVIESGGITQSRLADMLEIRPQSLTRVLSELEEDGAITRERDAKDRRAVLVRITEKGLSQHLGFVEMRRKRAASLFECLTEQEKEELHRLLTKVSDSYIGKENAE